MKIFFNKLNAHTVYIEVDCGPIGVEDLGKIENIYGEWYFVPARWNISLDALEQIVQCIKQLNKNEKII